MSQKQHNSHGKKALVFFSLTDECRCQQSRVVEQNSGIECDGREGVKKRQVEWHTTNCVTIIVIFFLLFKCTALFLVCLWIQQKAPLLLNQETSIRYDDYYTLDKNCKLHSPWSISFFLTEIEGRPFIHYISICIQNVLLARCAWPSDSWGKWKPISCRGAPSVPSMKSYYQCCYASPVTSNPIDAERHRWRLPATCSTVQFLQRGSLMGGPADKGQERWHCWHWWGTKWRTEKGGGSAGEDGGVGEKNVIIRVHEYCHSCLYHRGEHSKGRSNWRGWDKNQYLTTKNYCEWAGAPKCIT